jgi:hypothetical protein
MRSLLNMSVFQHSVLAAETHLAEGLALKLRWTKSREVRDGP